MVSHGGFPNIDITKGVHRRSAGTGVTQPQHRHQPAARRTGLPASRGHCDLEMGAIAKHCEIEAAVVARVYRRQRHDVDLRPPRHYSARLSRPAQNSAGRQATEGSHARIAQTHRREKSIIKAPHAFDADKFQELSNETTTLNEKLNYKYGGTIQ